MRPMYLDIETLRAPTKLMLGHSSLKTAPTNYKDPQKILEFNIRQVEEEWADSALDPLRGTICCVGVRTPEPGTYVIDGAGANGSELHPQLRWERALLDNLEAELQSAWALGAFEIVTFNGDEFDIPFLMTRAIFHGKHGLVSELRRLPKRDLRRMWAMGRWVKGVSGTLRDIARHCGWEGGDDIPGPRVHEMFAMGNYDIVKHHCIQDVEATAHIGRTLSECGFWSEAS